jgi:hypothetical protein
MRQTVASAVRVAHATARGSVLVAAIAISGAALLGQPTPKPAGGALAGERFRVLVSTDLGGSDEDDKQSLVHMLLYADLFDIEGLVASPPGEGRVRHILDIVDVYGRDYARLRTHSRRYPEPGALRAVTKQGALVPAPAAGWSKPTEGSQWIVSQARRPDPRPLYVLVWGSITDVAQAVHDAPDIKRRLRVYFIASWNERQDPSSFQYLDTHHRDLWFIRAESTFRGWYIGGKQEGDLDNARFVRDHICGHGALGDYFCSLAPALGADSGGRIKMGDTPSVAYLLRGNPDDPTGNSWGGRFVPHPDGRHSWWVDDPDPAWQEADRPGARTVSQHRESYLRDWQERMDRLGVDGKGEGPGPRPPGAR